MQVKEFHLIGTVQRQSVKLEVRPSDALDDLKCDLGGALGIWDPKGISFYGSNKALDTISDVVAYAGSIGRHKDHWENPERFDPDRWAAGPQGCVGFNVAKLEAKLALAQLIYRYHFEDVSTEPMQYDPEFLVIRPLNCYVRARRRTSWPQMQQKAQA